MGIEQNGTQGTTQPVNTGTSSDQTSSSAAVNDWIDVAVDSKDTVINVLQNDEGYPDQGLNITGFEQPANGAVVKNADGTFSYTPNPGYEGKDTFTYVITDADGNESSAMVEVYVINSSIYTQGGDDASGTPDDTAPPVTNSEPDAKWDDAYTDENKPVVINVLANDKDADGDSLTVVGFTQPPNGHVVLNDDGTFTYTPNPGYHGADEFEYAINDGVNAWSDTAKVSITVGDINQAPVAADDAASTQEGQPVVIDVLSNDSDPDGDALTISGATAANGSVAINADGNLVYTPNPGFYGVDTFSYTVTDPAGETSSATVTVTVHQGNEVPVAADDSAATTQDQPVTISVLGNDADADGDALTIASFEQPSNGTVTQNADGSFSYTPKPGFSGTDTFTYTVSDGNGGQDTANVSINVSPVAEPENTRPDADTDVAFIDQNQVTVIDVLANDSDADGDALSIGNYSQPGHGAITLNADGTFSYTPNDGFSGIDYFDYTVDDGHGGSDTAKVYVCIHATNSNPDAVDDVAATDENQKAIINVLGNDSDPDGDALYISGFGTPANGTVTLNSDGTFNYIPDSGFSGVDSFTYTVRDGQGGVDSATVKIVVSNVNDLPDAIDDTATTSEDHSVVINALENDTDADGDTLAIMSFQQPAHGSVVQNADGTFTYTPEGNYNGTDSFSYTVTDGQGGTDTASVQIAISSVNDDPIPGDDEVVTHEDQAISIDVLANDSDPDGDQLSMSGMTQPSHGTVVQNADGTLSYVPEPNFSGNDSFTYTIDDGHGGNDTATVYVCVKPVNDAPVAMQDDAAVDEDQSVTINVLENDTDLEGDTLSVASFEQPAHGKVVQNADGTLTYTPDPDFNGHDSFSYTVTDGNGGEDSATVQINVKSVNDAPEAVADSVMTNEDQPLTIDVLGNDSDVDGDSLTIESFTQPAHGAVIQNPDGTFSYAPNDNFNGSDGFTYTVTDGHGGTSTASVQIVVNAVNDSPVAVDDSDTIDEDHSVVINVVSNDLDADGDALSVTGFEQPAHGSVSMNDDGTLTYIPEANFHGTDSFTYAISDGHGGVSTATVQIVVVGVNDLPVVTDGLDYTNEDTPLEINLLGHASDADGDPLSIATATANSGTVTIQENGVVLYTPNPDYHGTDTITYSVDDGNGGVTTGTFTIVVNPVNDTPVAVDDSATTNEDQSVTIDVLGNDSDVDGDTLTVDSFEQPAHGTVVQNADGTFSYTPAAEFNGSDSFTYTVSDGHGGTSTATVQVVVNGVNDAPVAADDSATTNEDQAVTIDVLSNDSDIDGDTLTIDSFEQPAHGTVVQNADGTFSYTPAADFNGSDSFTYTVSDGHGGTSTATVQVVVNGVNDAPVAADDSAVTNEDQAVTIDVLGNDSDVDGDTLTIDSFEQPAHGTVVQNADGTFSYTPSADFNGSDSFTYTVSDGHGGTSTATVQVVVNGVNDAPVAADDSAATNEDQAVTIDVLSNDSDVDGDTLTVDSFEQPAHGTVVQNADGTFSYTPSADFNGSDSFTYTVSDGHGGTSTATVQIVVNGVNDAPVAVDDSATTDEDQAVTIDVLGNDSDIDGDTLTIDSVEQPAHGTVVQNADGTFSYTPSADFNGTDSFTYSVTDGHGGTSTATVQVVVNGVNDAPVAVDDSATTNEDQAVTIDVLSNDSDVDGDTLTVDSFEQPAHGTVVQNADGTFSYTPAADFNGSDSFTYTVSDGHGGTSTATVQVVVDGVNDAPVAADDSATTNEDQAVTIDVLSNDSDVDGDSLTVDSFEQPAHGTVVQNADGTFSYTPETDFNGTDSFTYTISDGHGGTSTASVHVCVNPVNDAPVAVDDSATTDEDQSVTIDVLGNDSDVDGDTLTVDSYEQPAHGTVVQNADGTFSYTPETDFNGTDSFTYTISDGHGGTSTASVHVCVNPVNDAPVAVDDSATTDEDQAVTIDVLSNDSDVDGDTLTVDSFEQPTHGTVVQNADGTFSYTPSADFNGSDSFTYTVSDGHGGTSTATVQVVVNGVNDAPVAADDSATTNEDQAVTIDVLSNDSDVDGDTLTVDSFEQPAHGTVVQNADGTFSYTPSADFNGSDSFTYTVSDGHGGTSTATVQVVVNGVNDAPVAADDSATTNEDQAVTIDVLSNDSDVDGDTLTVDSFEQPAHGTVVQNADGTFSYTPSADFNGSDSFTYTVSDGHGGTSTATVQVVVNGVNDGPVAVDDSATTNEDQAVTIDVLSNDSDVDGDTLTVDSFEQPAHGTVVQNADGTFSYTPAADFNGSDSFTYTVSDGHGGTSTATVQVVVNGVNDGPVAVDDSAVTNEDQSVTIDVLGNDSDVDGDTLTVDSFEQPAHGTVVQNADGTFSYTPSADFNGNDSFTYTVNDGHGGTSTATVQVVVNGVNDAPVAADDSATTNEDQAVTIDVLGNDSDVDGDTLTVDSFEQPAHGTVVQNADGTFSYTPAADFNGTDSFTYSVTDGHGGTSTATVQVVVNGVNDAPVAADDSATTNEDQAVTIDVLSNDSDVDGDTLTVDSFEQPAHGTVVQNADGTFSYTPAADFNGSDSFTYTVSDGHGGTSTATVQVVVNGVNDGPVAVDDSAVTNEDQSVTIDVLGNDSDVDGDTLTVDSFEQPAHGTVVQNADGTFSYTPSADFNGNDSFTYTVNDGHGGTSTATVQVVVNGVNDAPVAADDSATTNEDQAVTIDVLGNDSDVDGDTLTVDSFEQPAHGTVVQNADGTFSYMPEADFNGSDSFTYTVSDDHGGTSTATVQVVVTGVNDAPAADDDSVTTDEDQSVTIDVLSNDFDPDGDSLTVANFEQPAHGTVVQNADGTFSYTPDSHFSGMDSFTYTISDGHGGTDTATVAIKVDDTIPNHDPDANKDHATTDAGESVVIDALANDTDPDGDSLSIMSFDQPKHGTVALNPDGTFTYTPDDNYCGKDAFHYTVSDGNGGTDRSKVYVMVEEGAPENRAPNAVDDTANTTENQVVTINVLDNDSDPDGDPLAISGFDQPTHGSVVQNPDGSFSYTPEAGFTGIDSFAYSVSDGAGGSDSAVVTLSVNADGGNPVCARLVGTAAINEGEAGSYQVTLDQAVDHDSWYQIKVTDGSANRVDHWAGDQDIMAGGYYDVRRGIGGEVVDVIYGKVPNGQYPSDGNRDMVGPIDQSADFSLGQDGVIVDGDTVWVKVPAGQVVSDSLDIVAWREMVTVDRDANNAGDYYEGTEDLEVAIVATDNAGDVQVCNSSLDVDIYDTTSYAYVSPIAIDMNGDGIQTTALGATEGKFDLLNNGDAVESGWLSGEDAFLAVDANGNGVIDDRSELFGGQAGEGFSKLAEYDSNHDGVVNAQDERFDELKVWQDANENHQTDAGELHSLTEAGVSSLSTAYAMDGTVDASGNFHGEHGSVTMADGSEVDMTDVYFNMAPDAQGDLPSIDDLLADAGDSLEELLGTTDAPVVTEAPAAIPAIVDSQSSADALRQLADVYDQQPQDVDHHG